MTILNYWRRAQNACCVRPVVEVAVLPEQQFSFFELPRFDEAMKDGQTLKLYYPNTVRLFVDRQKSNDNAAHYSAMLVSGSYRLQAGIEPMPHVGSSDPISDKVLVQVEPYLREGTIQRDLFTRGARNLSRRDMHRLINVTNRLDDNAPTDFPAPKRQRPQRKQPATPAWGMPAAA